MLGNQRSFLSALVTVQPSANGADAARPRSGGDRGLTPATIQSALDALNSGLPHYKQIRAFRVLPEPFTMENGLLTTMGKLRRDAIAARYAGEIQSLYEKTTA